MIEYHGEPTVKTLIEGRQFDWTATAVEQFPEGAENIIQLVMAVTLTDSISERNGLENRLQGALARTRAAAELHDRCSQTTT
jgi:hypothetical protein